MSKPNPGSQAQAPPRSLALPLCLVVSPIGSLVGGPSHPTGCVVPCGRERHQDEHEDKCHEGKRQRSVREALVRGPQHARAPRGPGYPEVGASPPLACRSPAEVANYRAARLQQLEAPTLPSPCRSSESQGGSARQEGRPAQGPPAGVTGAVAAARSVEFLREGGFSLSPASAAAASRLRDALRCAEGSPTESELGSDGVATDIGEGAVASVSAYWLSQRVACAPVLDPKHPSQGRCLGLSYPIASVPDGALLDWNLTNWPQTGPRSGPKQ